MFLPSAFPYCFVSCSTDNDFMMLVNTGYSLIDQTIDSEKDDTLRGISFLISFIKFFQPFMEIFNFFIYSCIGAPASFPFLFIISTTMLPVVIPSAISFIF